MVTPEFNRLLLEALTPITLISSVGLLMLCMTARYNHTTNRIRSLMSKRRHLQPKQKPDIDREIAILYRRCALLRRGTILLTLSTVCSSILIAISAAHSFLGVDYNDAAALLLMLTVGLIVVASLYFASEIWLSLHALRLVIRRLPPPPASLFSSVRHPPAGPEH